jgi:hypothetical protein
MKLHHLQELHNHHILVKLVVLHSLHQPILSLRRSSINRRLYYNKIGQDTNCQGRDRCHRKQCYEGFAVTYDEDYNIVSCDIDLCLDNWCPDQSYCSRDAGVCYSDEGVVWVGANCEEPPVLPKCDDYEALEGGEASLSLTMIYSLGDKLYHELTSRGWCWKLIRDRMWGSVQISGDLIEDNYKGAITPVYPTTSYNYLDVEDYKYPRYFNTPNQLALSKKIAQLEKRESNSNFVFDGFHGNV